MTRRVSLAGVARTSRRVAGTSWRIARLLMRRSIDVVWLALVLPSVVYVVLYLVDPPPRPGEPATAPTASERFAAVAETWPGRFADWRREVEAERQADDRAVE